MAAHTPAPLLLEPVLLEKVWGGRALERLGKALPAGADIGESWELADMCATSASGAGGGEIRSRIASGPLAGRTLADAIRLWGDALLGDLALTPDGCFPLLIKFLDARENLSVQVHPSPDYAARHPDAHLKTESWIVLDAAPGAVIYKGLKPGVTRGRLAQALSNTASDAITDLLQPVPAVPGDCHTLPSGTVHALGAGVVVAEVQTPSDTTFRLHDWGRPGRQLHIEQALECADCDAPPPPPTRLPDGELCCRLATTRFFTIDQARPQPGDDLTIGYACQHRATPGALGTPFALVILAGSGSLLHADDAFEPVPVRAGQTLLIPAAAAPQTILRAGDALDVLRVGPLNP